jgi:hypothetical protein
MVSSVFMSNITAHLTAYHRPQTARPFSASVCNGHFVTTIPNDTYSKHICLLAAFNAITIFGMASFAALN